ncbi:hypothetical protein ACHAPV_004756 [Trichoderma viride]
MPALHKELRKFTGVRTRSATYYEDQNNALGTASLLKIAMAMIRGIVSDSAGVTSTDLAEMQAMLNYVDTHQDLEKFMKSFQADITPSVQFRFAIFS